MPRPRAQRGTVQQLGRSWRIGWWEYQPDGRRVRRWRGGFADRRSAQRELRKVLSQIDDGTYVPPSNETVGAWLAEWLEAQRPHVEPNTWETCRNHVRYYLAPDDALCAAYRKRTGLDKPSLRDVPLQQLTAERASRHLGELLERGRRDGGPLQARTVRGVRITLNAALASAYQHGRLPRPVRVRPVRVPKRRPTVYTPEQTRQFLQVALHDRLAAMWALLVTTALRPSEVLGLSWDAVDLDAGVIAVWQKEVKVGTKAVIREGAKTEDSHALLALAPWVVDLLRAWREQQREERRLWPGPTVDNGLVFTWEDGRPLKPDWPNRRFRRLAARAGLPPIRLYDLRHGWATAALRAGLHPQLVREVMRHAQYRTTAETYAHVMPTQTATAIATVAALFHAAKDDGGEVPAEGKAAERSPGLPGER